MKKITRPHLRNFLETHLTQERVLDIGGGRVNTNHSYESLFPDRYIVDVDPTREPDIVGDAHHLPIESEAFGTILCTEVLEHLHTPEQAVSEMYRVLRPGGKLILTTRFMYPLHDIPHDYYRYTKYGLEHLFRNWERLEITPETQSFEALAAILQRVIFQTDLRGGKITKALIYLFVLILQKSGWLIKNEYGDIGKETDVSPFITTGYYLVATKPS